MLEYPVPSSVDLDGPTIIIGRANDLTPPQRERLRNQLIALKPWRKGPFDFFGMRVDAEWRSELKWNRLQPALPELGGKRVLDVGCGNGYYVFRMAALRPATIVGLEPHAANFRQFQFAQQFVRSPLITGLPMGYEQFLTDGNDFDCVLLMGVLYHRRDPLACLRHVASFLRPGGTLILEGLYQEEHDLKLDRGQRYAGMRNVYQIPTLASVHCWLEDMGFTGSRIHDGSQTTSVEQRVTAWSNDQSLQDFLDPADPNRTIEGHPAPRRFVLSCVKC